MKLFEQLRNFWQREDGQDLVEYSLLLGFIALAATGLLTSIRTNMSTIWSKINSSLATGAS